MNKKAIKFINGIYNDEINKEMIVNGQSITTSSDIWVNITNILARSSSMSDILSTIVESDKKIIDTKEYNKIIETIKDIFTFIKTFFGQILSYNFSGVMDKAKDAVSDRVLKRTGNTEILKSIVEDTTKLEKTITNFSESENKKSNNHLHEYYIKVALKLVYKVMQKQYPKK